MQVRIFFIENLRGQRSGQRRDRRNIRIEQRIRHHIGLLHRSIEAIRGQGVAERKAIVEHAESPTNHRLRLRIVRPANRVRETDARREIGMIADVGLHLVAKAEAQREIRAQLPVVSNEDAPVHLMERQIRIPGADAELRRLTAQGRDLRRRISHSLKQQRAAIPFDRGDLHVGSRDGQIVRVQRWRQSACERERS